MTSYNEKQVRVNREVKTLVKSTPQRSGLHIVTSFQRGRYEKGREKSYFTVEKPSRLSQPGDQGQHQQ